MCKDKEIAAEKRNDLQHMKIMLVYSSSIVGEPRGLYSTKQGYFIEPIQAGRVYEHTTVNNSGEWVIS